MHIKFHKWGGSLMKYAVIYNGVEWWNEWKFIFVSFLSQNCTFILFTTNIFFWLTIYYKKIIKDKDHSADICKHKTVSLKCILMFSWTHYHRT